jgi:hypothetical protein
MKMLLVVTAIVLALSGCAVQPTAQAFPTVRAKPDATPQEVASVIAKYSKQWQGTIDKGGECRAEWIFSPTDIEASTCYLDETTTGLDAQIAVRDLGRLRVPKSMNSLVNSTTGILTSIGAIDLETACGKLGALDFTTQKCTDAVASRFALYTQLDTQLRAWSPYL